MNVFTILSQKKAKHEVYNSIKWVTRDYKEFNDYLESYEAQDNNKISQKQKAEMIEKYKGKSLFGQAVLTADAFVQLFEEYHQMCP
ncbi:MAG: hypothetical protein Q4G27_01580 [Flavobacteriaceae bacterium]|nr:hypothetical protein [Flavobacteriaceae bacterium]